MKTVISLKENILKKDFLLQYYNFSLFLETFSKVIILLNVYYRDHSAWCFECFDCLIYINGVNSHRIYGRAAVLDSIRLYMCP